MCEKVGQKAWLWARTLYLLLAIGLFWLSCFNWDAFLRGTVFLLAPCTVLLVSASVARRQVQWNTYHILLFAISAIFTQAAVRNGNLSLRGLLIVALCFMAVVITPRAFKRSPGRTPFLIGFIALAVALAALLLTVLSEYFEWGFLPWVAKQALVKGGRAASARVVRARERTQLLKGLTVLTYAWGSMLVAGIIPREMDDEHLRRESRIIALFVVFSALAFTLPAVISVFIARPVVLPFLPNETIGIREPGFIRDRIRSLQHPNKVAQLAIMGIFYAIYCLMNGAGRGLRGALIASIVVFAMALAHTQSRGGNIALGLGVGALAFRWAWQRFEGRRWRVPVGLVSGGLALILTILLINGLFTADLLIVSQYNTIAHAEGGNLLDSLRQNAAEKATEEKGEAIAQGLEDLAVQREDGVVVSRAMASGATEVFSSGRGRIWREGLDYLVHHPVELLLGMGSGDVTDRMKAYNPDRFYAYHLHNGFLEALARGGVFMLVGILWLLCLLVRPAVRMLVEKDPVDPGSCIFPILIGVLLATAMVEALLFTDATAYDFIFFLAAARVMRPGILSPAISTFSIR